MKRLLLLPLLLGLNAPVQAEIDPKVREACLPAADFLGCVKAYTTESTDIQNLRVIQGEIEVTGNSCPLNHGYAGAGYCQEVLCYERWFPHEPDLAGKHECGGIGFMFYPYKLNWGSGENLKRATFDPSCPKREPGIGWRSTCDEEKGLLPETASKKKNKLPMACRNGVWDKDHPKCQVKVDKVMSPMDMD